MRIKQNKPLQILPVYSARNWKDIFCIFFLKETMQEIVYDHVITDNTVM